MGLVLDRNLALVGFMTAGKTRVGQTLSQFCGLPFFDLDAMVERLEGLAVHQIFQTRGEAYFRGVESAVLRGLCQGSGQIIGCGGGTVLSAENRRLLKERCLTIWLRVDMPEVMARLENPESPRRPLLEGRDPQLLVPRLLHAREPLYAEADLTVETTGRQVEEIAREIALRVGVPLIGG